MGLSIYVLPMYDMYDVLHYTYVSGNTLWLCCYDENRYKDKNLWEMVCMIRKTAVCVRNSQIIVW